MHFSIFLLIIKKKNIKFIKKGMTLLQLNLAEKTKFPCNQTLFRYLKQKLVHLITKNKQKTYEYITSCWFKIFRISINNVSLLVTCFYYKAQ